jgi:hypothetical protein
MQRYAKISQFAEQRIPHLIDWEGGTILEFIVPPDDDPRVTSRGGSA